MAQADTAYLIGVIREWEKKFLEDDEYTRLIEAKSAAEAQHVLVDTPYGERPLEDHLYNLHQWLADGLTDERVYHFVSARFDALNIAAALIEKGEGVEEMSEKSKLGSVPVDVVQSAVWHDLGWENVPEIWESFIRECRDREFDKVNIMVGAAARAQAWQEQLVFTPLMQEITALYGKWQEEDKEKRPFVLQDDATEYERQQDEELLALIRRWRFEPTGYDPIIAFWYAKELEVRNLRLLLAAKAVEMDTAALHEMNRSLYRSWQ